MSSTPYEHAGPVVAGIDEGVPHAVVRFAAEEAALRHTDLRLVHAVPLLAPADDHVRSPESTAHGAAVVEGVEELVHLQYPDVTVTGELPVGHPVGTLVELSEEAALLVLGHRGGGFPRLHTGSVSRQVVTHAHCPVVVVDPERAATAHRPHGPVVIGVDVDDVCDEALDLGYAEADRRGVPVDLVYADDVRLLSPGPVGVVPPVFGLLPPGPVEPLPEADADHDAASGILNREASRFAGRYPQVRADAHVVPGRPADVLVEWGRGATVLVVGSRGLTGLRRLLLGSVGAEVLQTARCPVAVVPAPAQE
ncbi:universal stress protein [Streptomyces sp. DH12]|uniref:universal stress protein n=1 Tax=Streptomyces sp. DH12 TaxID=2857010 RepID=UPI001E3E099C|nr:universal stress protein [Streptomyces sp. DH12]